MPAGSPDSPALDILSPPALSKAAVPFSRVQASEPAADTPPPPLSQNQGLYKHAHSDAMAPSPPQPCLFSLKSCQICSERSDLLASGSLAAAAVHRLQQEVPSVQHYFCSVLVNLYDVENMCKCCWLRQIYEVNPCREHTCPPCSAGLFSPSTSVRALVISWL